MDIFLVALGSFLGSLIASLPLADRVGMKVLGGLKRTMIAHVEFHGDKG